MAYILSWRDIKPMLRMMTFGAVVISIIVYIVGAVLGLNSKEVESKSEGVFAKGVIKESAYRVIDGDTIEINSVDKEFSGKKQYGRLVCIDAPETGQTPWGITAARELRSILSNSPSIMIERIGTDRYNRALILLTTTGTSEDNNDIGNVQVQMVSKGLAYVYHDYKKNCPIYKDLVEVEQDAKAKGIGVWSNPNNMPPWEYRKQSVSNYY